MPKRFCDSNNRATVDTLVLIGNGFDMWQGLNTDYSQFENYYFANRDRILKKLGLTKRWRMIREDGTESWFGDVEFIYGNTFDPHELGHDFWHTFEDSLGKLNAERINAFFGKEEDDLTALEIAVGNAKAVLEEAFRGWISTITVADKKTNYRFGNNCLFVNFNYTDTLEKRFGVSSETVFHIHGKAAEKTGIIFGHALHPQLPVEALDHFGGRFRGLYLVEKLLYETDKHTYLHYVEFLIDLALRGIKMADIKQIYVLGHSFGPADFEYFEELAMATGAARKPVRPYGLPDINSFEALQLRIASVILAYGNDGPHPEFDIKTAKAFGQWAYQLQKDKVWESVQNQYKRKLSYRLKYPNRLRNFSEVLSEPSDSSLVKWHITYHDPKDKLRVEEVLHDIHVCNYNLYDTIDACIETFQA